MNHSILQVARKELKTFFASPVAFLFLGAFLAVNLFIFFWVEAFFSRNIADVRPLFDWMPILLIFLVSSLTMKMWSEERRMGTLEFLLTLPVSTLNLVAGKFVACLGLVVIALFLTLPVPITVSMLGTLDWGPVFGAYIASLFLAGVYASIGLFVSARSENQIVSLICSVLVCFLLYMVGTPVLGGDHIELFRLIGTGSRFESITRGVIDFRDLYYYTSLIGVFLSLNVLSIERLRWVSESRRSHTLWRTVTLLLVMNFVAGNFWLQKIQSARVDLTAQKIYSISPATRDYLRQLQEPLLIRGYFSAETHPLLAPLAPTLKDLIREYEIAGDGRVNVEVIDPRNHPEIEEEANRKYAIKSVPFQVAEKYQTALVNSYFHILIEYGDQHEVLSFQDFIEVKPKSETDIEITLRNPEYDITRSIKKVLYGFKGTDHLFASLSEPVKLTGYLSDAGTLPDQLNEFTGVLQKELTAMSNKSDGKFSFAFEDPGTVDSEKAQILAQKYNFRPMVASLLNPTPFYYYLIMEQGDQVHQVPLPENFTEEGAKRSLEAALKRFSSGFTKTVALHTAPNASNPYMAQMGMPQGRQFRFLEQKLKEGYKISTTSLDSGSAPSDSDLLLVLAPKDLQPKQVFAIDQFLMKGGTVVVATSPLEVKRDKDSLTATKASSGLSDWLAHHGVTIEDKFVLDAQNTPYPVPVQRSIGGFQVRDLQLIPYPFFSDIRGVGLNKDLALSAGIDSLTMGWASPVSFTKPEGAEVESQVILSSSDRSWVGENQKVIPDFQLYPELGFPIVQSQQAYPLAILTEGKFSSFFKGKESPLLEKKPEPKAEDAPEEGKPEEKEKPVFSGVIDKSPASSRLIVFASNEFLSDQTISIIGQVEATKAMIPLQIVQNTLDWSLEDRGLLSIRSRGHFARTLMPLEDGRKRFIEYINYFIALLGVLLIFAILRIMRSSVDVRYKQLLQSEGA